MRRTSTSLPPTLWVRLSAAVSVLLLAGSIWGWLLWQVQHLRNELPEQDIRVRSLAETTHYYRALARALERARQTLADHKPAYPTTDTFLSLVERIEALAPPEVDAAITHAQEGTISLEHLNPPLTFPTITLSLSGTSSSSPPLMQWVERIARLPAPLSLSSFSLTHLSRQQSWRLAARIVIYQAPRLETPTSSSFEMEQGGYYGEESPMMGEGNGRAVPPPP